MPHFTVVVIARNESQTLPTLLASLQPFRSAGGLVHVVDTGSDDDTAAVAQRGGCRVHLAGERFASRLSGAEADRINALAAGGEGPLVQAGQRYFDFAAARTFATSRAGTDMVLHLDGSDEVLAMDCAAIDARIVQGRAGALACPVRLGAGRFTAVRFYDRRWYRWEGLTHEALYPIPGPPAVTIPPTVRCDADELLLVHHRQEKERTYIAGLALQWHACPDVPRWWHYLGRELYYARAWRSAIALLGAHADMPAAPSLERSQSHCFIGECFEWLGEPSQAEAAYARAAAVDASWRGPLLRRASLLSAQGRFELAAACAEQALTIASPSPAAENDANYGWLPHQLLYWSLFWLGRRADAERHWHAYRELAPPGALAEPHAHLFAH